VPGSVERPVLSGPSAALAVLVCLVIWWASTAVLIYFNFIPDARPFVFSTSLVLAVVSVAWLLRNRQNETVAGAYWSFTAGLTVWAFVKASFYTGYLVGPDLPLAQARPPSWESFFGAVHTSLYHELLVITLAVTALVVFRGAKNRIGLHVFLTLAVFHSSAKLNVFLGVPNTGSNFLPETVAALKPYMTTAGMNLLFPISVTLNSLVAFHLLRLGFSRAVLPWKRVGYILVGTMASLALFEHWLLLFPM
jgi:putative photosynthetic complex assembly protein 2